MKWLISSMLYEKYSPPQKTSRINVISEQHFYINSFMK